MNNSRWKLGIVVGETLMPQLKKSGREEETRLKKT